MKKICACIGVSKLVLGMVLATLAVAPLMAQDWPMFGVDATNTATNGSRISTNNVNQLKPKWTFTTGGDVSARAYGVNLSNNYTARGSVVAVSEGGAIQWKTYTVPYGYIGGGVWGSNPVVDRSRNMVYIGTGDNYSHPHSDAPSSDPSMTFGQCIVNNTEANCLSPDDHVDSILALNMRTGAVRWSRKLVTRSEEHTSELQSL